MFPFLDLAGYLHRRKQVDARWSDRRLISACLRGDEKAWSTLVQRYQRLVYAIPIEYGLPPDEAAEIFQLVWVDLHGQLPELRRRRALRARLVELASARSRAWWQRRRRADDGLSAQVPPRPSLAMIEENHRILEAISHLCPVCQRLIERLFFSESPLPYREAAADLGLDPDSPKLVGGRCLRLLQRELGASPT